MTQTPDDLLKPLRGMYLAQLRERAASVTEFLKHCRTGKLPAGEAELMHGLAHKLAGSGTTYGFPLITQSARALEEALAPERADAVSAETLVPLVESLDHACAQALLMVERESDDPAARMQLPEAGIAKPVILAADDDPVVRETLTALFGKDFTVVTAGDGREALRLVREQRPQLILLDEAMPKMSGLEMLEALQADEGNADIPVIMLTAKTRSEDVLKALSAGASDYIVKPFKPQELAEKVRTLLSRSGKTVLIADDDPAIRELLAYKFRMAGVRVQLAADGEEALRLAVEYKPQLAVLDRMMPGLDGVAVLQQLRANAATKSIPVMFLTALRQERDILEGFRLGVADYVIKPFLPEEVLARGMRLLGLENA